MEKRVAFWQVVMSATNVSGRIALVVIGGSMLAQDAVIILLFKKN